MIATSNVNENDGGIAPVAVAAAAAASITTTAASVRLWLAAEADRVKALSKWNELTHHNVECGRCGCHCTEGECGGIPIRTDFRWEKKDQEVLIRYVVIINENNNITVFTCCHRRHHYCHRHVDLLLI
jgi:hypothetical protein